MGLQVRWQRGNGTALSGAVGPSKRVGPDVTLLVTWENVGHVGTCVVNWPFLSMCSKSVPLVDMQ